MTATAGKTVAGAVGKKVLPGGTALAPTASKEKLDPAPTLVKEESKKSIEGQNDDIKSLKPDGSSTEVAPVDEADKDEEDDDAEKDDEDDEDDDDVSRDKNGTNTDPFSITLKENEHDDDAASP